MTTRRGAARGSGKGYRNLRGFPKDPLVHSQSSRGMKQPQKIQNKIMKLSMMDVEGRRLRDKATGETYSAHAGDYWNMKPNEIFEDMELVDRYGDIIKNTVRKKDLVDNIYHAQAIHLLKTKLRKPLKKSEMQSTKINGHNFDEKGRFIVNGEPSDTWTFEGIADRWGRKVLTWQEYAKNPSILKEMKGSFFVMDMDNGTNRIQGKPINKKYPDW